MKRLLAFGIGGFVGKYLAEEFERFGYEIYGTDLIHSPSIPSYVHFQTCDLMNAQKVSELIRTVQPTHIVNLAAVSSVALSWKQPQTTVTVNVVGAINILEGIRNSGISAKVLMIGSSEEYAVSDRPIQEDFPLEANNPYGLSKIMLERFLALYRQQYNIEVYQVRAFNHTGIGQSSVFVLAGWCDRVAEIAASGETGCMEVGNLDVWRDFSDVRDIVRAYRMIIESDDCEVVYNVGSGTANSLSKILDTIISFSGQTIDVKVNSALLRPVDNPYICCDHTLITRKLGWIPEYNLIDTLHAMFEHCKLKYWKRK